MLRVYNSTFFPCTQMVHSFKQTHELISVSPRPRKWATLSHDINLLTYIEEVVVISLAVVMPTSASLSRHMLLLPGLSF